MKSTVECVWQAQAELAESTIWVDEERALYFVDGPGRKTSALQRIGRPKRSISPRRRDWVHCAAGWRGLYRWDGQQALHVGPGSRSCDGSGLPGARTTSQPVQRWQGRSGRRSVAGNSGSRLRAARGIALSHHQNLSWKAVDGGYVHKRPGVPPDGRILYHTDSMRRTIYQFDLDLDGGAISNKRVFVQIDEHAGLPDGMTVDCDGRLWVAHFGGARVTAFTPSGTVDESFPCPLRTSRPARRRSKRLNTIHFHLADLDDRRSASRIAACGQPVRL